MKKKLYFLFCMLTCMAFLAACGKNDANSDSESSSTSSSILSGEENEEGTTTDLYVPDDEIINPSAEEEPGDEDLDGDEPSEVPVNDAYDDDDDDDDVDLDEEEEEPAASDTTDVQNKVSENPTETFNGSGTFNGFVDSSSVEVTMSDGTYQTFFVYDEDVLNQLQQLEGEGNSPTIRFTYRGIDGQVNPEITSLQ